MKECKMLRTRSDVIACVRWLDSTGRSFRISVVPPARNTIHYSYGFLLISFPLVCSFCECHVRRDWASVVVVCVSVSFCLFRFRLSHRAEGTSTVLRLTRWRVRRRRWSQTTLILISLLKSELDTFIRCALRTSAFQMNLRRVSNSMVVISTISMYDFVLLAVFWWNSTCRTCTPNGSRVNKYTRTRDKVKYRRGDFIGESTQQVNAAVN